MSRTIAAIATAPGPSGVGIIRISGDEALSIGEQLFVSPKGRSLKDNERMLCYGHIVDKGTIIDEVLCVYMKAPFTYTTEDIVEIHCHGGYISVEKILSLVLETGASHAEPGEFTKLAFINGRIDLSQAESIIDIINAKSAKSFEIAQKQLSGGLSSSIKVLRDNITEDLAGITVAIDFPEEDIEDVTAEFLKSRALHTITELDKLIKSFETGRILREGLKTVIVGRPNVGKSSLLNAMLEENRAIVTNIEGTTRDVIKESYSLSGIALELIDTAGLRDTEDVVEKIGVEKTLSQVKDADLVLVMLDVSRDLIQEDLNILENTKGQQRIILVNKDDLTRCWEPSDIIKDEFIFLSAVTNQGIDTLKEKIKAMVYKGDLDPNQDEIVTNIRHKDALVKAKKACEEAVVSLDSGLPLDLIETDYKRIWEYLGEITGDTVTENLLDTIFANFCIGK